MSVGFRGLAAWMTAEGVKDAEANGCTVTPLEADQTVGLPDAMKRPEVVAFRRWLLSEFQPLDAHRPSD